MRDQQDRGGSVLEDLPPQRTSDLLAALASDASSPSLSIADIVERLGDRTFGTLFLLVGLCTFIPSVPGTSGVVGTVLMLISAQLALGARRPWLPGFINRLRVRRSGFAKAVAKIRPGMRGLERLCRPRLAFATTPPAEQLVGLVALCLGFIIALPIPFVGNLPPAFAMVLLALGLIERDGLIVLLGLVAGLAAIAVTSAFTLAVFEGLGRLAAETNWPQ